MNYIGGAPITLNSQPDPAFTGGEIHCCGVEVDGQYALVGYVGHFALAPLPAFTWDEPIPAAEADELAPAA